MSLQDYGLSQKEGKIYDARNSSAKKKILTDDELFLLLKHQGIPIAQIEEKVQTLKIEAQQASKPISLSEVKVKIAKEMNPFKNLFIVTNITNRSDVVYYRNGTDTETVCSLDAFDSRMLRSILRRYEPDFLDELHQNMANAISPKDWTLISDLQVLDICLNTGIFNNTVQKMTVKSDMHPAVVSGSETLSLTTIPYSYQENINLDNLHIYLKDFLSRVEHHEYLCALLYSHFLGNLLPYVIYLRGEGGDGKTSFVSMLGRLARSFATFDSSERFNYFNMYGKSIIGLNENESSKLMQSRVLKSISGGNYVQIEGKGRNSFAGQVRGLVIVDSNYDLELIGREDEKRRLRYFKVSRIVKSSDFVTVSQDYFVDKMLSTSNEFLNYCRQWYEQLQIPGSHGLISANPNHDETFQELVDVLQEHRFSEFYRSYIQKRFIFKPEEKCNSVEILTELERRYPRDPYVVRNFKKYFEVHHNVKCSGKYFVGLCKYNKELQDAMPRE